MKRKSMRLALMGLASLSLVVTGCDTQKQSSQGNTDSSIPDSSTIDDGDDPVITYSQIELLSPSEGESFNITPTPIANYLNAETEEEQIATISEAKKAENKNPTNYSVKLSWKKDGSANYTIYLATKDDFSDAREIKVSSLSNTYEAKNLIPNATYYWKVKGTRTKDTSSVSSFKTTGSSVRLISASGAYNIRDLGGWKAGDKQIAYGKLYRGGLLNNFSGYAELDEAGIKTFNEELGMKTEIDLRITNKDDADQKKCYFDESKTYIQGQLGQYNRIIDPDSFAKSNGYDTFGAYAKDNQTAAGQNDGISVKTLREIFKTLADEDNYPVYFHCNAGADRTGTLAFLIEGLLGVSYEDTIRDYELTSFSKFGERLRSAVSEDKKSFTDTGVYSNTSSNYVAFGELHDDMVTYYGKDGGTLSDAIYNYLTGYVGVQSSEIASLKKILLGEEENSTVLSTRQEFLLSDSSISLDLLEAGLDEGSIASISIAGTDLGSNAASIDPSLISGANLAGERDIVIKAKKDGEDITVYAPVLLITKIISTVDEFVSIDTYRHKSNGTTEDRVINYGYYRLANDIGSDSNPVKHGGWILEQISGNGCIGFRGTLDGNGKTVYISEVYGGFFSCIGGGAKIENITFAVAQDGVTSGDNNFHSTLAVVMCGAILDDVTFNVLSDGWGDNYSKGLFASGVGFISCSEAHGCLIKDVTVNSDYPIVSLFGGLYYGGMGGMKFENLTINCAKLGYLGIKRTISGKTQSTITVDDCYLPMEFEGISGSYQTSSVSDVSNKLVNGFASIGLGSKYGAMDLITASYQSKKIVDATLINDTLMFDASSIIGDNDSIEGTLSLKLQKGDIICTYSLKVTLTK